jgi:hypothetical protein
MSARPLPADTPGTPPATDEDEEGNSSDEEQPSENGSSSRTKTPQTNLKQRWLLTYGASNPYITPEMLNKFFEKTNKKVEECHSTKDRAMAVTYLHLDKKVRKTAIEDFMKEANEKHGIVQNPTYESIASFSRKGKSIEEHIGFKLLLKHYIAKDPAFKPWTDHTHTLKRGLIFEASLDTRFLKTQSHRVRKTSVSKDKEQLKAEVTKNAALKTENAALKAENAALKAENAAQKRRIQELEGLNAYRTEVAAELAALKRDIQEIKRVRHD